VSGVFVHIPRAHTYRKYSRSPFSRSSISQRATVRSSPSFVNRHSSKSLNIDRSTSSILPRVAGLCIEQPEEFLPQRSVLLHAYRYLNGEIHGTD
jgi:hypothetical protein